MKLVYHQAVVGFCADLTKADEKSVPVATLLVGKLDDEPVAAMMVFFEQFDDLDAMTRRILEKVPDMLRQHVDEAFRGDEHEPLDRIIVRLHHSLRNSLHVTKIDAPVEVDFSSESDLRMQLIEIVVKRMGDARAEIGAKPISFERTPEARQRHIRLRPPVAQGVDSWTPAHV